MTDTYQATYEVITPYTGTKNGITSNILPVTSGGLAGIQVDTNTSDPHYVTVYTPTPTVQTSHIDYNTLGQKIDSYDQYGGETTYTYDANATSLTFPL